MANWSPLRERLASVDRLTISWQDLDALVGGLPRSAYDHSAFWKGDRSGWPGFRTTDVRVGRTVTFVRQDAAGATRQSAHLVTPAKRSTTTPDAGTRPRPDIVLVGCVKRKLPHAAPARDLYDSALFRKERAYAERSGADWFVLSAKHGLVEPSAVLEPYDLQLSKTSVAYRRAWGARVVASLVNEVGALDGRVIEIHAGAAYADAVRDRLVAAGAVVVEPLHGLTMGQRLKWYPAVPAKVPATVPSAPAVDELIEELGGSRLAMSPADFLATNGSHLRSPGLYSWWVDPPGAEDLGRGLGEPVKPGLIYAGLAGATRGRSGRKSTNTLWGRIKGMHLGGRHDFSTFRLSLGAILASATGAEEIDEIALTAWMHIHLRVKTVVVEDGDALDGLETQLLAALDPPLNLDKMTKTPVRARLSDLRRKHRRGTARPRTTARE